MTPPLSSPSSGEYAERAVEHERLADHAWSTYQLHTQQAHHYRDKETQAKRHERRVAAVDDALRQVP